MRKVLSIVDGGLAVFLAFTLTLGLVTLAFAGCGPPGAPHSVDDDPMREQHDALRALEDETGVPWRVRWHPDVRTPALLEGRSVADIYR